MPVAVVVSVSASGHQRQRRGTPTCSGVRAASAGRRDAVWKTRAARLPLVLAERR